MDRSAKPRHANQPSGSRQTPPRQEAVSSLTEVVSGAAASLAPVPSAAVQVTNTERLVDRTVDFALSSGDLSYSLADSAAGRLLLREVARALIDTAIAPGGGEGPPSERFEAVATAWISADLPAGGLIELSHALADATLTYVYAEARAGLLGDAGQALRVSQSVVAGVAAIARTALLRSVVPSATPSLIAVLPTEGPGLPASAARSAAALGMNFRRPVRVLVVVDSGDPEQPDPDPLGALRRVLDGVQAIADDAVRSQPFPHAIAVLEGEFSAIQSRLATEDSSLIVLTEPERELAFVHRRYLEALSTAGVARAVGVKPGLINPRRFEAHRLLASVEDDAFVEDVLGNVLRAPSTKQRDRLTAVLRALCATDGTLTSMATHLGVSTKTVRQHFREVQACTGYRAEDVDDLLLLQVATILHATREAERLHPESSSGRK